MFNVRVEYDPAPIRHIAVQCPECKKWFRGREISKDFFRYDYEINFMEFNCPICGEKFGGIGYENPIIEEVGHPEIYDGCLERKEIWE